MRFFVVAFAALVVASTPLHAQDAVVSRNINLRGFPSVDSTLIRKLLPGAELFILEEQRTNGYYHVRTMDGVEGWAYGPRVRMLPEEPAGPTELFNNCPMEGNAQRADIRALNLLKNRYTAPAPGEITTLALTDLLAPGDDETRFNNGMGATVIGYVLHVKPGSAESVNCGANTVDLKDAHIELTLNATDTLETRRFVVEITPKWRAFMAEQGENWSTTPLRNLIRGQCAEFTGWMFWDKHHRGDAENTDPGTGNNWRATAWEIHPVTAIRVVPCPS